MSTATGTQRSAIRTPDQRLRIFVSSTLQELAPERRAAREAIERLAAAPVMFELGARPHPPRSLYRAYLEQSDIFVAIYWQRYGWVAPGETISGLEDEYNLAPPGMPKLVYIKETRDSREPRLEALLDRVRGDDSASYQRFTDADELGRLLVTDLAVLLAERFDETRSGAATTPPLSPSRPPSAGRTSMLPPRLTKLFGREDDVQRVVGMLRLPEVRLVTLIGPGGIGKTRLSLETARRLEPDFPDGAAFVPLAQVDDPAAVPAALAQAVGVLNTGDAPLEQKLDLALRDRRMLLVLDNFEQILAAAPVVAGLLESAPGLKLLITSRSLLRLTGEHSYEVPPLALPGAARSTDEGPSPAVELFLERARSVKPDFELGPDNRASVEAIVERLEGLPLAIELAAARMRLLTPSTLLSRLDRQLSLLVGGRRDAPERQQAVRNTIEWSTRLLSAAEQDLLWRLGVFSGRFSLEAVDALVEPGTDALGLLEPLVDASLVRQQERSGRTYFSLLAMVREYARERLDALGLAAQVRARHAAFYTSWALDAAEELLGGRQRERAELLTNERDNLRAAARHLLETGDWTRVADLMWALFPYWWMSGLLGEARSWAEEMLRAGGGIPDRECAMALSLASMRLFWERPGPEIVGRLERSVELFERTPDIDRLSTAHAVGVAFTSLGQAYSYLPTPDLEKASATLSRGLALLSVTDDRWAENLLVLAGAVLDLIRQDVPGATRRLSDAVRHAEETKDALTMTLALYNFGWLSLLTGSVDAGAAHFARELRLSVDLDAMPGAGWGIEGAVGVAALRDDPERAGLLLGAAEVLRERLGLPAMTDSVTHMRPLQRLLGSGAAPAVDAARARGRLLSTDQAIALALEVLEEGVERP